MVCCAAPSDGVFVVAPDKMPSTAARSIPNSQPSPEATTPPKMTTTTASEFSRFPPRRSEEKKPGPNYRPMQKTNKIRPNSLTNSSVAWSIGLEK